MYHYFYKALFKGNSENIVVLCLKLSSKILVIVHEYPYKQIPWNYHDFWKSLTKKASREVPIEDTLIFSSLCHEP